MSISTRDKQVQDERLRWLILSDCLSNEGRHLQKIFFNIFILTSKVTGLRWLACMYSVRDNLAKLLGRHVGEMPKQKYWQWHSESYLTCSDMADAAQKRGYFEMSHGEVSVLGSIESHSRSTFCLISNFHSRTRQFAFLRRDSFDLLKPLLSANSHLS